MTLHDRQLQLELNANDYSFNRLMKEVNSRIQSGQADELSEGKLILVHSIELVSKKLTEYFEKDIRGKMKAARDIVAIEFSETPKDLAFIILATIVRSISKEIHIPTISLVKQLNRAIYDSILVRRLDRSDTNFGSFVDKRFKTRSDAFRQREKLKIIRRQRAMNDPDLTDITTYLGGVLLDIVIKSGANIIETRLVYNKDRKTQYIMYTDECFKMVLESRERLLLDYRRFPILLARPKDWDSFEGSGGYYNTDIYKLPIIKCRMGSKKLLKGFFEKTDTEALYDTLNTLQGTAWRVNRKVYEVMDKIFQENLTDPESPHTNPYLYGNLPYNEALEPEDFINIHNYGEIQTEGSYKGLPADRKMMRKYFKDIEDQRDIVISNTGKAIMLNLVLFNAKEYLDEEGFYFSYQYDFRGRIYPIQQHLQPQSKGEVKALLEFRDGCSIEDEEQLRWFLIHGANCYGFDKLPYQERVDKIKEMHDTILEIADDPFGNITEWKGADEPFLYLAWCFEYAEYVKSPKEFKSHIPIALDATCSGIQIYSGLLLDKVGAEAVNVIGTTRQDIYQRVADKVNGYLESGDYFKSLLYKTSDGKSHEASTQALANSLRGKVTRGLTKRNTMTQPYSVTKFGMFEQNKLEFQSMENNNRKFWVGEVWLAAKLLTDLNDRAIAEVVKGARVGQEFLKEVTQDVVRNGRWVFYTTPITRFPVLQKLHKTTAERITTPVGKLSIRRTIPALNTQKMVNGIAPNYIHSLDAALLALTVLKLKEDGCKNFHLIHDSYGVPVNQVANLNLRVREAYIELFGQQPLKQFMEQVHPEFDKTAEDVMIGTLDLKEVADSMYIFS
jgi:DNA-directed RNA polymerase